MQQEVAVLVLQYLNRTGYPIPNPLTCAIIHLLAMASFQWFITIFIIYSRGGKKVSLLSDDRTSIYLIFEI